MTGPAHPAGQAAGNTDALAQVQARNKLIQAVRDSLKGQGLDIRERTNDLVITHPGNPENGRIHITLPNGDVSHARTVWTYLGHLDRHGPGHDPDDEPRVDADLITATLTGQADTPT
jgi:hypothetical protein